jgi:antitoxin Phd
MAWQVFDAKARFSELLDTTLKEGPQVVTRRGVETAVLVPIDEWKRLKAEARPNIKDILLDPNGPHDLYIPPAGDFVFPRRMIRYSRCTCSTPM